MDPLSYFIPTFPTTQTAVDSSEGQQPDLRVSYNPIKVNGKTSSDLLSASFQTPSAGGILSFFQCGSLHRHHGHLAENLQHEWGDAIPIFSFPFALLPCWLFMDQMLTPLRGWLTPRLTPAHPFCASCSLLRPHTASSFWWTGASNLKEPVLLCPLWYQ